MSTNVDCVGLLHQRAEGVVVLLDEALEKPPQGFFFVRPTRASGREDGAILANRTQQHPRKPGPTQLTMHNKTQPDRAELVDISRHTILGSSRH